MNLPLKFITESLVPTFGMTPSQRLVRRPLPYEQVDSCDFGRLRAFYPTSYDAISGFRFEKWSGVRVDGGYLVDSRNPGTYDNPWQTPGAFPED